MKVFVINLPASTERAHRMSTMLTKADIKFEFIKAISPADEYFLYSDRRNEQKTKKQFGYKLEDTEIACFASHHLLWEKCLELNEPILIMEDNCELMANFSDHFQKLDQLTRKYQYIKLAVPRGRQQAKRKIIEKIDDSLSVVRLERRVGSTTAYAISPLAAKKFIAHAQQFIEPVDDYMAKPYKHGVFTYCLYPWLACRALVPSNIGARKNKQELRLIDKAYIETFRLYEQFKNKTCRYNH
ncbi:glycosyltransferase family 25 protein [Celerinatantimonas sp. YJH-8]|uniref:glycosyltransferase family 25 protein n=1 Tax=Celerinatantimonas sp. YJH-8 TaxID=3228714 RepID=UPI0038C5579B